MHLCLCECTYVGSIVKINFSCFTCLCETVTWEIDEIFSIMLKIRPRGRPSIVLFLRNRKASTID